MFTALTPRCESTVVEGCRGSGVTLVEGCALVQSDANVHRVFTLEEAVKPSIPCLCCKVWIKSKSKWWSCSSVYTALTPRREAAPWLEAAVVAGCRGSGVALVEGCERVVGRVPSYHSTTNYGHWARGIWAAQSWADRTAWPGEAVIADDLHVPVWQERKRRFFTTLVTWSHQFIPI